MKKLLVVLVLSAAGVLASLSSFGKTIYVEYVQASGKASVDTGYKANAKTVIAFSGQYVNRNGQTYPALFKAYTAEGSVATRVILQNTDEKSVYISCYSQANQSWGLQNVIPTAGQVITGLLNRVTNTYVVNGKTATGAKSVGTLTDTTIKLHDPDKTSVTRLHYLTISEDGVVLHDFRPCVRDDVVGYVDLVDNSFHTSSTGTLTAGPDIIPSDVLDISTSFGIDPGTTPACGRITGLADGSQIACSAPATYRDPSGSYSYACTGYRLYDCILDPTTWKVVEEELAGSPYSGSSFTYEHGTTMRKLVWQYDEPVWTGTNAYVGADHGDWSDPANWSVGVVPRATDEVLIAGKHVTLTTSVDVTIASLTLAKDATLSVRATRMADLSTNMTETARFTEIWNSRIRFNVTGAMTMLDGSRLVPDNEYCTGTPVAFNVASFSLAERAEIRANNTGFAWYVGSNGICRVSTKWTTWCPGHGNNYGKAGSYGAKGNGQGAYGYRYAPFLPGGQGTYYGVGSVDYTSTYRHNFGSGVIRGGGSVLIFASGKMTLRGLVEARGKDAFYGPSAGGGIWLNAASYEIAPSACLKAVGGSTGTNYDRYGGAGGRIALAVGLTDADIQSLAETGEVAEDLTAGELTCISTDVRPGIYSGDATTGVKSYQANSVGTTAFVYRGTTPAVTAIADTDYSVKMPAPAGAGTSKSFVGADGGDWFAAANWSPAGVPSIDDDVTLGCAVNAASGAVRAKSLTLGTGAALTLGTDGGREALEVTVAGDVTLSDDATLTVYAPRAYAPEHIAVFKSALTVLIGGKLTLDDQSAVYPYTDYVCGTPVKFKSASVSVAAGAKIDADGKGYDVIACSLLDDSILYDMVDIADGGYPVQDWQYWPTAKCSLGPGCSSSNGSNYYAPSHGAKGTQYAFSGIPYGYSFAPWMSGSRSSPTASFNSTCWRGGGAIWIEATQVKIDGTLTANGGYVSSGNALFSTSSGGGIWIVTKAFTASAGSSLSARGGDMSTNTRADAKNAWGAGGRISIGLNLSASEATALAQGTVPDTVTVTDGIVCGATLTVRGGQITTSGVMTEGYAGTLATATGSEPADTSVEVTATPCLAVADGVTYGVSILEAGDTFSLTLAHGAKGLDPSSDLIRYSYTAWTALDEDGETIAEGTGNVSFTAKKGANRLVLHWTAPEHGIMMRVPAGGKVVCDGVEHASSFISYGVDGTPVTFEPVPDNGYEFLYWIGDVPKGEWRSNPLVTDGVMGTLEPVFRPAAAAATYTWTATHGFFYDAANWDLGRIPGPQDTAVVPSGYCCISNYAAVGHLTVSGSGQVYASAMLSSAQKPVAATNQLQTAIADPHLSVTAFEVLGMLSVSGNASCAVGAQDAKYFPMLLAKGIDLSDSGLLTVTACATNGTTRNCTAGCALVKVSGLLSVRDRASYVTICDQYTGGSVKTETWRLELATNAWISSRGFGYNYFSLRSPRSLAPGAGYDYNRGGGHGGKGAGATGTIGQTYDVKYAPVMPGSHNGTYALPTYAGGGVVRIHAVTMDVRGTIDVRPEPEIWPPSSDVSGGTGPFIYGGSSGGSIYLTCEGTFKAASGAKLLATGGHCAKRYAANGGGGRIAIVRRATPAILAQLEADGDTLPVRASGKPLACYDEAAFEAEFPGVDADVETSHVEGSGGQKGTFFMLGKPLRGLILLVK